MADPTAVTVCNVTAFNTPVSCAAAAATATVADKAETFQFEITGKPSKVAIIFSNANSHGAYAYSIAAGVHATAAKALTGTIAENKANEVIQIETGKVTDADGKINITLTPAEGKILLTNHAATIRVINLI